MAAPPPSFKSLYPEGHPIKAGAVPFSFPHVGWASRQDDTANVDIKLSPRERIVQLYKTERSPRQDGLYMVTRDKEHKKRYAGVIDRYFPTLGRQLAHDLRSDKEKEQGRQFTSPGAPNAIGSGSYKGLKVGHSTAPRIKTRTADSYYLGSGDLKPLSPASSVDALRANLQHASMVAGDGASAASPTAAMLAAQAPLSPSLNPPRLSQTLPSSFALGGTGRALRGGITRMEGAIHQGKAVMQ